MTRSLLTLVPAIAIALTAAKASADPISVGDGLAFYARGTEYPEAGRDLGSLISNDFLFPLIAAPTDLAVRTACAPCAPGAVVNPSATFQLAGPTVPDLYYHLDPPVFVPVGTAYGEGTLNFFADPIEMPQPLRSGEQLLTTFFTFSGNLRMFDAETNELLFAADELTGRGHATLAVIGQPQGYRFYQISYLSETAAVPEPSTMLLLGSGLAFGLLKRKLRV